MRFIEKQFLFVYGLFFCWSVASLFFDSGIFGLASWSAILFFQYHILSRTLKKKLITDIFLLGYYLISLTLIYYIFGFSLLPIVIWHGFNFIATTALFFFSPLTVEYRAQFFSKHSLTFWFAIVFLAILAFVFWVSPETEGLPSPWTGLNNLLFVIFLIASWLVFYRDICNRESMILSFIYLFVALSVVAFRYDLTFGFDTLLHQAALRHISENGRISPISPFYIGQYVWELLINLFTGWDFTKIERWFGPVSFVLLLLRSGSLILGSLGAKRFGLISLTALLLLPTQFYYSSPYNYALSLGILTLSLIFAYFNTDEKKFLNTAKIMAVSTLLAHPLVGINILYSFKLISYIKNGSSKWKIFGWILTSSSFVILAFIVFNWIGNEKLILSNPIFFVGKFLDLFSDPVWYVWDSPPFYLMLGYWLERLHLPVIVSIAIYLIIKRKNASDHQKFFGLISLSFLVSAWFFASSFEIPKYTKVDQMNYAQRLLIAAKWAIWPVVLEFFQRLFDRWRSDQLAVKVFNSFILAFAVTIAWYFTYLRQDDISRINVSSIRHVDYQAIELIYETEGGKGDYLVFANQLFGAGAINKYGFGPYYNDRDWGQIHYYSVPMGSELNRRYEKIMTSEDFDPSLVIEPLKKLNLCRAYLIITDYWPLSEKVEQDLKKRTDMNWNIDDKVDIYRFDVCQG